MSPLDLSITLRNDSGKEKKGLFLYHMGERWAEAGGVRAVYLEPTHHAWRSTANAFPYPSSYELWEAEGGGGGGESSRSVVSSRDGPHRN